MSNSLKRSLKFFSDLDEVTDLEIVELFSLVGFGEREDLLKIPNLVSVLWPGGAFGVFARVSGEPGVVGLCRVFSDQIIGTWIAEICVHPEFRRLGIGSALLESVRKRFPKTALYVIAFRGQENFFSKVGLRPKDKLIACSAPSLLAKSIVRQ